jgi:hypothetical protein
MQQRKRRMRLLNPTDPVEQRYFTQLSAAGGQHYTIPSVTIGASDDFELEIGVYVTSNTASGIRLLGVNSSIDNRAFLSVTSDYKIAISFPQVGVIFETPTNFIARDKYYNLKITVAGSSITFSNGIGGTVTLAYTKRTAVFTHIARHFNDYFNGYLSDVKISINNTLVRHYPLDDSGVTNVARELVSGADGARVNLTQVSTKLFTKEGNTWVSGSTVLEIAP